MDHLCARLSFTVWAISSPPQYDLGIIPCEGALAQPHTTPRGYWSRIGDSPTHLTAPSHQNNCAQHFPTPLLYFLPTTARNKYARPDKAENSHPTIPIMIIPPKNDAGGEIPYHMQDSDSLAEIESLAETASHGGAPRSADNRNRDTLPAYSRYETMGKGLFSSASVTDEGKIVISLDLKKTSPDLPKDYARPVREYAVDPNSTAKVPGMNIVIMIVGSRGDVQPYIVLSKALQQHGHRVRLATHETFRKMVRDAGLEFFSIGGDPAELMSYMVRNPGLLPGFQSLTNGDIPQKRTMLSDILDGCWKACHEPDTERGVFAADAIISNPPAFAHIHIAEALGIPLHLSFTMPWCATTAFPHPLVVVNSSNAEPGLTNYLSYALADLLQWQGLGDVINRFRMKTLNLQPLSLRSGPSVTDHLKVPWTYCFSPTLIPQPRDWSNHIDVVGFYFLEGAKGYTPNPALQEFLDRGEPPVYIGFGSVVVKDADAMTQTIFQAVMQANVRAIVSAGWGGLGGSDVPDNIFILPGHPGVPHDWLFTKVSAVCHHGGAGTTAIGLLLGKPTIIVPFFGDQPFWGKMVYEAGAGPEPIPPKKLTVDTLVAAIEFCETPHAKAAAQEMGDRIRSEDGPQAGVKSFHAHLPLLNMRCDLDPTRVAVWWSAENFLKLSAYAAKVLIDAKILKADELELHRPREYETKKRTTDPISGGLGGIFWTVTNCYDGIVRIFSNPVMGLVDTTTALPRGFAKMVDGVQEGFRYAPTLYGSTPREVRPITDWKSGMKEGGKGLLYGCYDGITKLVTEPVKGAQKDGFVGALKGTGRGLSDLMVRPAAGALGLVTYPTRGLVKTIRHQVAKKQGSQLRETRHQEGERAIRMPLIPGQPNREQIIQAFWIAKVKKSERRKAKKYQDMEFLRVDVVEPTPKSERPAASIASSSQSSSSGRNLLRKWDPRSGPSSSTRKLAIEYPTVEKDEDEDEEERYRRDMELAMGISRQERRWGPGTR